MLNRVKAFHFRLENTKICPTFHIRFSKHKLDVQASYRTIIDVLKMDFKCYRNSLEIMPDDITLHVFYAEHMLPFYPVL